MKPFLEHIKIEKANRSFQFFKASNTAFLPFWHNHPELELTLITKGDGTRFIGDSIASFTDFDLVLVGENLPHHWVSASEDKNQEAYVFQFKKTLFDSFKECVAFKALFENAKRGLYFNNPKKELIQKIIEIHQQPEIKRLIGLLEVLNTLLSDTNFEFLASEKYAKQLILKGSQTKIAKTTNYIIENIHQNLTVNEMANFTHMVPQSFCRWFKKHSGHSFISFLNQTRIEKACQFLLFSELSVEQIAFSCGYKTLSHFNRTFKRLKNLSPSHFRKVNLR